MKKQIISAIMALGMLVSSLPATMAATYPSEDSKWEYSTRTEGKGSYEVTRSDAYNGEYSLYVDAQGSAGAKLFMKTNTAGTHKISFYAKEIQQGWSSGMRVASSTSWAPDKQMWFVDKAANSEGIWWTRTPMENGWVKYEGSYWNEQADNGLVIYFAEGAKYYFDDIKVENDGKTVIFEDFEETKEVQEFNWTVRNGKFEVVKEENGNHYYKLSGNDEYFQYSIPIFVVDGNYTVKLRAKKIGFKNSDPAVGWNIENYKLNADNWTITEGEDGWNTYEKTFNFWLEGAPKNWNLTVWLGWNDNAELLIDDISWKDNKKDKIIVSDDCEPAVRYEYPNELISLSANGYDNKIVLTWRNPDRNDIKGFEVYEGSQKIEVSEELSTEARALNTVTISPEDDAVHTYKVAMTAGGEVKNTTVSGKRNEFFMNSSYTKDGYNFEHGRLTKWNNGGVEPFGSARIDTLTKHSGNSSLCINPNFNTTHWDNNIKLQLGTKGLSKGKTYKLSYYAKYNKKSTKVNAWINNTYTHGVDANGNVGWVTGGSPSEIIGNYDVPTDTYDTSWMKQEFVFTCGGDGEVYFSFGNGADNIWVDDITLYEYDEATGKTSGENKIYNGGFEYKLDNCKLDGNTITWSVPEGAGWDYVNIYTISDGITSEPVRVDAKAGTYTLPELNTLKEKIVVKGVRASGLIFETECATFERTLDSLISTATYDAVSKTGENSYEVTEANIANVKAGLVRSNVKVANNKVANLSVDVYTALYKGDTLVKVEKSTATPAQGSSVTAGSVIEVPSDGGNYTIKTFVFNADTIIPQTEASAIFTPAE